MRFTGRQATEQGNIDFLECEYCGHSFQRIGALIKKPIAEICCYKCSKNSATPDKP